jgi:hypothetical protein
VGKGTKFADPREADPPLVRDVTTCGKLEGFEGLDHPNVQVTTTPSAIGLLAGGTKILTSISPFIQIFARFALPRLLSP